MEAKSPENSVPAPLIMELHQRMGFPLAYCKSVLEKIPADLQRHFVEFQTGHFLRDPIEGDPAVRPLLDAAYKDAQTIVEDEHRARIAELEKESPTVAAFFRNGRGLCHRQWSLVKKFMKELHAIDWQSPAELNPGIHFD